MEQHTIKRCLPWQGESWRGCELRQALKSLPSQKLLIILFSLTNTESNPNNNRMMRQACLALETHLKNHTCSTMPDLRFELRLTNFIFTSKMEYVDYVHWSFTSQIVLFFKPCFSSLCFPFCTILWEIVLDVNHIFTMFPPLLFFFWILWDKLNPYQCPSMQQLMQYLAFSNLFAATQYQPNKK